MRVGMMRVVVMRVRRVVVLMVSLVRMRVVS